MNARDATHSEYLKRLGNRPQPRFGFPMSGAYIAARFGDTTSKKPGSRYVRALLCDPGRGNCLVDLAVGYSLPPLQSLRKRNAMIRARTPSDQVRARFQNYITADGKAAG